MESKTIPSYIQLFRTFFWIGLTGFGGLAITAHIRKHIVDKRMWLDGKSFDAGLALCQIIPGAIVMQLTAYIGLKLKGIKGSLVSFIGFGLPAFLIMFILSVIYKHSKNISGVEMVLSGLRVVIVSIVANAAFIFGKSNFKTINDWIIAILAAALFLTKLHPVIVLTIAALLGVVLTNKEKTTASEHVRVKTFKFFLWLLVIIAGCAGLLFILNQNYFKLATIMLHVDLLSFGGGLAAVPVMYNVLVDSVMWFDEKTFMDGIILGQITPGSIIIAATFFGFMQFGFIGSIIATICVFTPSFLILMGIIPFYDRLRMHQNFYKVINGILCSFVGLLAIVTYRFTIGIHWSWFNLVFALASFILLVKKVDVIWIVMGSILLTILINQ
jgi:chromate transporter